MLKMSLPAAWHETASAIAAALNALSCRCADGTLCAIDDGYRLWREKTFALREQDKTVFLAGNGASASMASHFSADLANNARVRAEVFTDQSRITAIGNDIGFEHVFAEPIKRYSRVGDMFVAISSSGNSPNIIAAAKAALASGVFVVTLSGFREDNALRCLGMLNFYVSGSCYGLVESCHAVILHHWLDSLLGNYPPDVHL